VVVFGNAMNHWIARRAWVHKWHHIFVVQPIVEVPEAEKCPTSLFNLVADCNREVREINDKNAKRHAGQEGPIAQI